MVEGLTIYHHIFPASLLKAVQYVLRATHFLISCPLGGDVGCSRIQWQYDTTGIRYFGKVILTTSSLGELISSKRGWMGFPVWVSFQTTVTLPQFVEAMIKANKK